MDISNLIKENKGTIIDVRTPQEYRGGQAAGSINIPLQEIVQRFDEIQKMAKPLIVCCASGARSGSAQQFLSQQGLECYNAGSWLDVNYLQAEKI